MEKTLDEIYNELGNAMSDEKLNRLNEIMRVLEKSISDEDSQIFNELVSIIQDYLLKINNYELHIFRMEKAVDLYRLNTKDENSFVGLVKMLESSSKEEIKRYFLKYLTDKSMVVMEKLYDILGDSTKKIARRPNQIGSVGGDTEKCWAFDIDFVDWEIQNHKSENGSTLDNCDYWLPIIRKELNIKESYWHESNYATIWIFKEGLTNC
jgi:hypothetical protein